MALIQNQQIRPIGKIVALLFVGMFVFVTCLILSNWIEHRDLFSHVGSAKPFGYDEFFFYSEFFHQLRLLSVTFLLVGALASWVTKLGPFSIAFWLANPWGLTLLLEPVNKLGGLGGRYGLWWDSIGEDSELLLVCFISAWVGAQFTWLYVFKGRDKSASEPTELSGEAGTSVPPLRAMMLLSLGMLVFLIASILEESWAGRLAVAILGPAHLSRDYYWQEYLGLAMFGFSFYFLCFLVVGFVASKLLRSQGIVFALWLASPWVLVVASDLYVSIWHGIHERPLFSSAEGYISFVSLGEFGYVLTLTCFLAALAGALLAQRKTPA